MLKLTSAETVEQWSSASAVRRRRSLGIYYTPSGAAHALAEWAIRKPTDTVLEPSFGGCSMLSAAVSRLSALGSKDPGSNLMGFDIDRRAFEYLGALNLRASSRQFSRIDFLKAQPDHKCSVILGNPPYVGYHQMRASQRRAVETWRKTSTLQFSKQASLWAYFVVHSLAFLQKGGRLAFIVPPGVTTAHYARPLLRHLASSFASVRILQVTEQLFANAGANERCAILLADDFSPERHEPVSIGHETVTEELGLRDALTGLPSTVSRPSTDAASILTRLRDANQVFRLGDNVSVTIGEVVGDVSFFVKSRQEWRQLGIPNKYLRALITRAKQVPGLKCESRDVRKSIPVLLSVKAKAHKKVSSYLATYPKDARAKNRTFSKRKPWYAVSYDSSAGGFMNSLSHHSPRIVINSARATCANGLYKLKPLGGGVRLNSVLAAGALSTVTQLSAEGLARIRGPGALKLEPSDVRDLLIPATYRALKGKKAVDLVRKVDSLLRRNLHAEATALVDDALLVRPRLVSEAELGILRAAAQASRSGRLGK